jgi:uncharacterized protein YdhG (YjbR/CyaY superfamily)
MDNTRPAFSTIDEYIAGFPAEIQEKLREIRRVIHETAPRPRKRSATRCPRSS